MVWRGWFFEFRVSLGFRGKRGVSVFFYRGGFFFFWIWFLFFVFGLMFRFSLVWKECLWNLGSFVVLWCWFSCSYYFKFWSVDLRCFFLFVGVEGVWCCVVWWYDWLLFRVVVEFIVVLVLLVFLGFSSWGLGSWGDFFVELVLVLV